MPHLIVEAGHDWAYPAPRTGLDIEYQGIVPRDGPSASVGTTGALARIPFINGGKIPVGILSRVDSGESCMPRTATNRGTVVTRDIDTDTQKASAMP
jgi:hypothetical protein